MTPPTQAGSRPNHGVRRANWLAWSARLGAAVVIGLASCSDDTRIDGQVFISGIKDAMGNNIGVAVDFIPTRSDVDPAEVVVDIHVSGGKLLVSGVATDAACVRMPSSGRLTLPADAGKLATEARVLVIALRENALNFGVPAATPMGGSGGTASTPSASCPGAPIDDAIWPNPGATSLPSAGGASQGGSGGSGGSSGGVGGGTGGVGGETGGIGGVGGSGGNEPMGGSGGTGGGAEGGSPGTGGVSMSGGQSGEGGGA